MINRNYPVSETAVNEVHKAMEALGYQPNLIAGSLRSKKTKTIGLIIPDISNPFFAEFAKHLEEILLKSNYSVIFTCSYYDLQKEIDCINTLTSRMIDGLIIAPTENKSQHINALREKQIPVIVIDREIDGLKADLIKIDGFQAMYDMTVAMINKGHKSIAYIDRLKDHTHNVERKEGYLKALSDHGIQIKKSLIVKSGYSYKDAAIASEKILNAPERPSAIITFMDVFAISAIRKIQEIGLRSPEDIAVAGFGDLAICEYITPTLTTVHFPIDEMSREASDLIISRIENKNYRKLKHLIIPTKIIFRESTGDF